MLNRACCGRFNARADQHITDGRRHGHSIARRGGRDDSDDEHATELEFTFVRPMIFNHSPAQSARERARRRSGTSDAKPAATREARIKASPLGRAAVVAWAVSVSLDTSVA